MEDESVNTQEVAETGEVVETSENTAQEVAETETQGTQETQETSATEERDYEKDAAFANLRRQLEEARQGKDKLEKDLKTMTSEKERLAKSLGLFGFTGETTDDIEDQAKAYFSNTPVEQIRQARIAEAERIAKENSLAEQLKYYQEKEVKERMAQDLAEIQKLNPTVKSLEDLPKEYFDLIAKGVEGSKAYKLLEIDGFFEKATQNAEQNAIAKIQANTKASVGSANNGQAAEKVSYANMSDAEFEKLIQKVKRGETAS